MPSDRTRTSDDLSQRYKAVVMQQGRVILDRDFDALQEIVNGRIAADALDEIGPCGTPDNGFAISLPGPSASTPSSASYSMPNPWDFLIAPGTMYVGGQRVVLPAPGANQAAWSYFHQPDWIVPEPPAAFSGRSQSTPPHEYVYLHVYEQEVGAVEDSDLLDVALGGPDTSQRVRLMWRVVRKAVEATDCASALQAAEADWAAEGYLFDPTTMRLLPRAAIQVSFTAAAAASTPCDPVAQGGYLGAENQLIRLQIAGQAASGAAGLLWGYDDASFLYRVSPQPDGKTLLLNQVPVDAFHCPATNQVVEVLRTAAVLGTEPDATDPTGSGTIVRCVAEATGFVATVATYSNSDNTVALTSSLPAPYLNDANPLFLRIWQGQQSISLSSQPITLIDPTTQTSPGIQVTLTVPAGGAKGAALPAGAFWMIAARPSTPQAVYPERFLTGPQPPDGPRQWICPLAVIDWERDDRASYPASSYSAPGVVIDCRQQFCNLVNLSKRLGGCCTISVRPSDSARLQTLLDNAVGNGQPVKVCFLPGTYSLPQPLQLTSRHSGLVLEACNGGVTIQADAGATPGPFQDGLVTLVGADGVTLRGLTFIPTPVAYRPNANLVAQYNISSIRGLELIALIGLRPVNCLGLTVDHCRVEFPALSFAAGDLVFASGFFAAGDCTGLTLRGCSVESKIHTHVHQHPDEHRFHRSGAPAEAGRAVRRPLRPPRTPGIVLRLGRQRPRRRGDAQRGIIPRQHLQQPDDPDLRECDPREDPGPGQPRDRMSLRVLVVSVRVSGVPIGGGDGDARSGHVLLGDPVFPRPRADLRASPQASTTGLRQAVLLVQGTAVAPPASIPPAASIPSPVATHPASIPPPIVTPPRPRIVTMAVMPARPWPRLPRLPRPASRRARRSRISIPCR